MITKDNFFLIGKSNATKILNFKGYFSYYNLSGKKIKVSEILFILLKCLRQKIMIPKVNFFLI
jgi:hypothetical protein